MKYCHPTPLFLAALLLLPTGCRVVKTTAGLPGKAVSTMGPSKDQPPIDPVELQQRLMRFADEFTARIASAAEQLRRETNALDRIELEKWKLAYATETVAIASGQNAVANLLDMIVLATMSRISVEEYWLPKVYGESARPMLLACQDAETTAWLLAKRVLTPEQTEELRQTIRAAYDRQGDPQIISHLRAVGLVAALGKEPQAQTEHPEHTTSLLGLMQLDPLAGLDPAAREIAQSRLFAERALFVAQRMALLMRWQTEMLTFQLANTPEAAQVLTNLDRFGQSADALARAAEQLPKLVNDQREAAIKQVFDGLTAERTNFMAELAADEKKLTPTLTELRQTLNAGTDLTRTSDQLVNSVDKFLARFDKGTNAPPPSPASTNSRPFDILDYATTAKEVTASLKELNTTIDSLDKAIPQIQKAGQMAEVTGNRLLNRVFLMGAGLIVLLLGGALLTALIYRRFTRQVLVPRKAAVPETSDAEV